MPCLAAGALAQNDCFRYNRTGLWLIGPAMDLDVEAIKARLEALRSEHRDLDEAIARIADKAPFNQLQIQRLKKRKLVLKDLIIKLESQLVPDIIA
jgi:hypothetical protein